jgi:hypothetical protein
MNRRYLLDLAERTAATYVETLCGLLIVGWADWTSVGDALDFGTSAAVAAVPAALAVVKGGLARLRGDKQEASLLPVPIRPQLYAGDTSDGGAR